jgi:hypothetical protein
MLNNHTKSKNDISWVTQGTKTSCKRKRELYLIMKKSVNTYMKICYDKYCKRLKKVVTAAKKMEYENYCMKMHDKMKATWKIINIGTGRLSNETILSI